MLYADIPPATAGDAQHEELNEDSVNKNNTVQASETTNDAGQININAGGPYQPLEDIVNTTY